MNRHTQFVAIVQTGALVQELQGQVFDRMVPRRRAVAVVARATEISEDAIPLDVAEAANAFLDYAFARAGYSNAPEWYEMWRESLVVKPSW